MNRVEKVAVTPSSTAYRTTIRTGSTKQEAFKIRENLQLSSVNIE